ncbi:hypothetical protein E2542_SST13877 [Spatholobus suberectus]|nr:hypothetical protein E2542_SST13877 [Spatholobus suberectus]
MCSLLALVPPKKIIEAAYSLRFGIVTRKSQLTIIQFEEQSNEFYAAAASKRGEYAEKGNRPHCFASLNSKAIICAEENCSPEFILLSRNCRIMTCKGSSLYAVSAVCVSSSQILVTQCPAGCVKLHQEFERVTL